MKIFSEASRTFTQVTVLVGFAIFAATTTSSAQKQTTFASVAEHYDVLPDQIYRSVGDWQGKLDLYLPIEGNNHPLVMFIHGGGWTQSSKETEVLYILPYLQQGWAVANVEYRLASTAKAPASVLDCRCAFEWIQENATRLKVDAKRIVVAGISAGGHLALSVATVEPIDGKAECYKTSHKPAAIVNLFGPSDINELIAGPKPFAQAVEWFRGVERPETVAELISPIKRLSKRTPPVITLHGVDDEIIPYSQSAELHRQLTKLGVRNRLISLRSEGHGGFSAAEWNSAYQQIFAFVRNELRGREGGTRTR
ncbi:MAG TPA: alpha/beta hydrolase [Pyrinomonadaceae bacterium]